MFVQEPPYKVSFVQVFVIVGTLSRVANLLFGYQHAFVITGYKQTVTKHVNYVEGSICGRLHHVYAFRWPCLGKCIMWCLPVRGLNSSIDDGATGSIDDEEVAIRLLQLIDSHFIMHYIAGISPRNFVSGTVSPSETRSGFVLIKQGLKMIALLTDMTIPWWAQSKNGIHGGTTWDVVCRESLSCTRHSMGDAGGGISRAHVCPGGGNFFI